MEITRRQVMQVATVAGAGMLLESTGGAETRAEKPLRFVHLTDMHVPVDGKWEVGFGAALEAARKFEPAFMITGGDHVHETLKSTRESAVAQWKLYREILAGTKLPAHPVLGNHDIWGWAVDNKEWEKDGSYGKRMGLDGLEMKKAYYSFDAGAWHFVILDSQMRRALPDVRGYYAALDPEQMEWLKGDLAGVPKSRHICVVSHIPILAACVFYDGDRLREGSWHVPDAWMHRDSAELQLLFMKHGVKLAISGHIHLYDVVAYNGVTYVCDGAVCGGWWKGSYHETPPGFGVFDLYADGRFEHKYVDFGWKARELGK